MIAETATKAPDSFRIPAFWSAKAAPPAAKKAPALFRISEPKSRNLLIVNRGRDGVRLEREGDKWDLLEIYFVPSMIEEITRDPSLTDAEHVVFESDRKWRKYRIMKAVFEAADFWHGYDAIMIADDDLTPVGCTISEIFDLFLQTGCRVGQPALAPGSQFAHPITVQNNNFVWRRTNFVEVMCPVFTPAGLRHYLPVFDATVTNFGLDFYWGHHETRLGHGLAILDRTPMRHYRPQGTSVAYEGIEGSQAELKDFMEKHGISFFPHSCLGGMAQTKFSDEIYQKEILRLGLSVFGYSEDVLNHPRFGRYIAHEIAAAQRRLAGT